MVPGPTVAADNVDAANPDNINADTNPTRDCNITRPFKLTRLIQSDTDRSVSEGRPICTHILGGLHDPNTPPVLLPSQRAP